MGRGPEGCPGTLAEGQSLNGHWPALRDDVVQILQPRSGGFYFDGTVGEGGHARAILEKSSPEGRLLGVDVDAEAIASSRRILEPFGARVTLLQENYRNIREILSRERVKCMDGILVDLGVSSLQFDSAERGFSLLRSGPLDMRMNPQSHPSAYEIVRDARPEELERIIREWGEEPRARRITRALIRAREQKPIETTGELARIVARSLSGRRFHRGRHPATRVFQALRIAVNRELENLSAFLPDAFACLKTGGRMVVISYHSLEDRMVKRCFKSLALEGEKELQPAPVRPGSEEIRASRGRVRSAKLRAVEKVTCER